MTAPFQTEINGSVVNYVLGVLRDNGVPIEEVTKWQFADLRAEIKQLTATIREHESTITRLAGLEAWMDVAHKVYSELTALRAENKRLREAGNELVKFAKFEHNHSVNCGYIVLVGGKCDCGLDDALKAWQR